MGPSKHLLLRVFFPSLRNWREPAESYSDYSISWYSFQRNFLTSGLCGYPTPSLSEKYLGRTASSPHASASNQHRLRCNMLAASVIWWAERWKGIGVTLIHVYILLQLTSFLYINVHTRKVYGLWNGQPLSFKVINNKKVLEIF